LEQQHGDDWSVAMTTLFLATLAYRAGRAAQAVEHLRSVLGLGLQLGNRALLAATLQNIAFVIASALGGLAGVLVVLALSVEISVRR